MKFYRFAGLLLIALLVVAPLSVFAQGTDQQEFDTYTSEDQLLTLSYPKGWVANKSDFLFGASIASSQDLVDMMQSQQPPSALPSGAVLVDVTLANTDTLQMFGMDVKPGTAPEEMLRTFLDFISGQAEEGESPEGETMGETGSEGQSMGETGAQATEQPQGESQGMGEATEQPQGDTEGMGEAEATVQPEGESQGEGGAEPTMTPPVVGEIQTVEFDDGRQAAYAQVQFPDQSDDVYIAFEIADGAYAIVDYFTAPGELNEDQIQTALQIAQSVQFTGTAQDLAMPAPQVEQSDVNPSTLNGEELVNERCTTCHTRQRIDSEDEDEAGWTNIVDRMIAYGAQLNSAERQAVIDYLVATH